jgi:hypothetical protein
MTITPKPEQEQLIAEAIRAGLVQNAEEVLDIAVDTLRGRLETRTAVARSARQAAIQGMREFGDKYRLSLGEPITRDLLHEGHRY